MKHVAQVIAGQAPPSKYVSTLNGSGVPFLQGNAEFGLEHPNPKLQCTRVSRYANEGDILLSVRAPVGALNIADQQYAIGRGLCAVRSTNLRTRFMWWATVAMVPRLAANARGSTYDAITADDIGSLEIPCPTFSAQARIADYLDRETARIDALIAAKRRMVDLFDERWQVVLHNSATGHTIDGERRSTAVPWLSDVPRHWREGQLKLVAKLGTGHTPSRSHPEWWVDAKIPWITTGEVAQMRTDRIELISDTRELISELGLANSSATLHPAGTVVLCRTASAGYSAIMGRDMATSQDFATWSCGPLLRPRFLLICLRAMRQDLLGRLAMGSTHQTIYMPDIESIKVPIPPVAEQDALVEAIQAEGRIVEQCISRLKRQIDLLQERRQALITAAVTGQIDVPHTP